MRHLSFPKASLVQKASISLLAVALALTSAAQAHQGRGVVIHEGASARPAQPGYEPPPPETLGGPFELIDHKGQKVTDATWRGKWMLMFFGFAGCREACPTGLESMAQALEDLGPAADNVQPLFVDIDFAGPDLRGLTQYIGNFHPRLVGLTGNRRQMYAMLRNFQVRREIKHQAQGKRETGPRIDHTAYFYLIDPTGKTRTYFQHSLPPAQMAAIIKKHF